MLSDEGMQDCVNRMMGAIVLAHSLPVAEMRQRIQAGRETLADRLASGTSPAEVAESARSLGRLERHLGAIEALARATRDDVDLSRAEPGFVSIRMPTGSQGADVIHRASDHLLGENGHAGN